MIDKYYHHIAVIVTKKWIDEKVLPIIENSIKHYAVYWQPELGFFLPGVGVEGYEAYSSFKTINEKLVIKAYFDTLSYKEQTEFMTNVLGKK